MLFVSCIFALLHSTGPNLIVNDCENQRLAVLAFNAKLDPSRYTAAVDELTDLKEKGNVTAALRLWELEKWATFHKEDDPHRWPQALSEYRPTMVFTDSNGHCTAFWGGFAYSVGSQFQKTGWFITEMNETGMELEHKGNEIHPPTWEKRRVTFKQPYLKPHLVGPDGFSAWRSFIPDDLSESWMPSVDQP